MSGINDYPGFLQDLTQGSTRQFKIGLVYPAAYVVPDETPFSTNWLSLKNNGKSLVPNQDEFFTVMSDGDYYLQCYQYFGNSYLAVSPIDITGWSFEIRLSTDQDPDTDPAIVINIDTPTNPTEGYTIGKITDEQTAELPAGNIFYVIEVEDNNGNRFVLDMGRIRNNQNY